MTKEPMPASNDTLPAKVLLTQPQTIDVRAYCVPSTTWQAIENETQRLSQLLNSKAELTSDDVHEIRALAKKVNDCGVMFRRAVTQNANSYKILLADRLAALGYDQIEKYLQERKLQSQAILERRLSDKLLHFSQIVDQEIKQSQLVKQSVFAGLVANSLARRFPKVNSAAKHHEIKDWTMITTIVRKSINDLDAVLAKNPSICLLPATSHTAANLLHAIANGDNHALVDEEIQKDLQADRQLLETAIIRKQITNDDVAVAKINQICQDQQITAQQKITLVRKILQAYSS